MRNKQHCGDKWRELGEGEKRPFNKKRSKMQNGAAKWKTNDNLNFCILKVSRIINCKLVSFNLCDDETVFKESPSKIDFNKNR